MTSDQKAALLALAQHLAYTDSSSSQYYSALSSALSSGENIDDLTSDQKEALLQLMEQATYVTPLPEIYLGALSDALFASSGDHDSYNPPIGPDVQLPVSHSVIFKAGNSGYKNAMTDWHIVPTSRPVISPPAVKTNYVDVPGANSSIDFTEALRGFPVYQNRTGSIEFVVLHEYWSSWISTYQTVMEYLHGKKIKMWLEDDPDYYYEGRFAVNTWKSNKDYSRITIDYNVSPFKMENNVTTKTSTNGASVVIPGSQVGDMPLCPGISSTKNGLQYEFLNPNINRVVTWTNVPYAEEKTNPKVVMTSGGNNNTFNFRNGSGTYTTTITYRRGYL